MNEKLKLPLIDALQLVTPGREFPPATPHTYAHLGEEALAPVIQLRLPELARVYELPTFRNGQAGAGQ